MKEPRSQEHEQVVLAGMMNDESCYYDAVTEMSTDHFTSDESILLYRKMISSEQRMNANMLSRMANDPRNKSYVRAIDSMWTSKEDFYFSLEQTKETYLKRQLFYAINKATSTFEESDYQSIVETLDQDINSFSFDDSGENIVDPKERASKALSDFMERVLDPDAAKGIPYSLVNDAGIVSGFPSMDRALNGAYGGDLIMIAGKTGEGKTGFALNLARHFSFRQNYRGYYANTEMRLEEMEARLLAPLARVKANEIYYGRLEGTVEERKKKEMDIGGAYETYRTSQLILSRIPNLPLHKAKGLARQVKSRYGTLDYMIVDYVGRMDVPGFDGSSWDELYQITKQLKELAMTLDIPIFMLAQRNDAGDVEGAKKMMNECDGVLYFEPTTSEDKATIDKVIQSSKSSLVNYKLVKRKVRRDDNPYPIFCFYDKAQNMINEVTD